jgi:peptidoglycan/LPS O-acetylase OafA/YrhL
MTSRAARFPLFDSLRAIAAITVLCFHAAGPVRLAESDAFYRPYVAHLDVGVTVFFLISGFLLYRPFALGCAEGAAAPEARAYAWRRFLRIVPAYWVALTFVLFVLLGHDVYDGKRDVLRLYTFTQLYDPDTILKGISQAWTLCVEVTFYAFLPIWALAMRRLVARRPERWLRVELVGLACLFAGSLAYKAVLLRGALVTPENFPAVGSLPGYLDQFAIGMTLAVLSVRLSREQRLPRPLAWIEAWPGIAWAVALAAYVAVCNIGLPVGLESGYDASRWLGRDLLFSLVALGLLLPAVFGATERGVVRRVLANRVLLYLGLVSYGIFLWHLALINKLQDLGVSTSYLGWVALGLAAATVVASLSYYLVERPALRLKDRVGSRPGASGEATREPAPAVSPRAR